MPKPIQLSDSRYARLRALAEQAGYIIKRGPASQLGEFLDVLMEAWDGWHQSTAAYNALIEGLEKIGISVTADEGGWYYRTGRRKSHRFANAKAAIVAAIEARIKRSR